MPSAPRSAWGSIASQAGPRGETSVPKILIAECKQEVASCDSRLSHYEDFRVS